MIEEPPGQPNRKGNSHNSSHQEYYENEDIWKKDFFEDPDDKERILEIIASIPEQARSVIEVGCGSGAIVNNLIKLRDDISRIVGVDISAAALDHVKAEKYQGNINNLAFDENSFDCVIASEVIEHLTCLDYLKGIKEMQRVAHKWILISVPNEDDLEQGLRMCQHCYCWFNPNYHMNSFNKEKLKNLFDKFEMEWVREIGPAIRETKYSNFAKLACYYKNRHPPKIGICPQCGFNYTDNHKGEFRLGHSGSTNLSPKFKKIITLMDILFRLIFARKICKKRWLLALYKNREQ